MCQWLQARVIPEEGMEELLSTPWGQRVEPQLRVIGLTAPAVLILGPIVDQQQEPAGGQALDQAVEQGLRLGIKPVQGFHNQEQGLPLACPQQHALERGERALTAWGGIELVERTVVG